MNSGDKPIKPIGVKEWRAMEDDGWRYCNAVECANGYFVLIYNEKTEDYSGVLFDRDESRWVESPAALTNQLEMAL